MIFKVFYQNNKDNSPRREQTKALYLDISADDELKGRIIARQLIEEKTKYNVEYIEAISEEHLAYEKDSGAFELTEL
ncbi:DNA-directed RNA polymerase subunit epsilon [Streptococcus marimammalium]|uniref:DNA-directed RNA polymerase subunit epsilon n=1 Tax=Streptococcus marimammalium TaxID=269666 RepID=UPI00036178BB|nr:DNA-directed RNA polymerase subunit epsilon [Streptococcus marimammalium]